MIYNERQFKISAAALNKLLDAKTDFEASARDDEPWIVDAQLRAMDSQIEDLEQQVTEYRLLREGKIAHSECNDLAELPRILISARIAKGLSQKDLATELGMTQQQVQRYEATDYMSASLSRLIEVSRTLGVTISENWGNDSASGTNAIYSWADPSSVDWSLFPLAEMLKRDWLTLRNKENPNDAVENYFMSAAGPEFVSAFHRKKFYGERAPNEYALIAWQARVLQQARRVEHNSDIKNFVLDDSWISELCKLSLEENGPQLAEEFLLNNGIVLIIEKHLKSTYLDGAAMLSHAGNPVIGMTLRHDRLDNFWFVLLHELGHIFLHLSHSMRLDFFDAEHTDDADEIEREADKFALDSFASPEIWSQCISRFAMTEDSVLKDSQMLGIHPSIIAGRLRKESNNYYILHDLLGSGAVRSQFGV